MTREEAINRFKGIRKSFSISIAQSKFYPSKVMLNELCDMAIEALQSTMNQERVNHESTNDLISRVDAIKTVEDITINKIGSWYDHSYFVVEALEALPSAEAIDFNESCEKCEHHLKGANEVPCCYCTIGKSFYTPTEQGEWIDIDNYYRLATCSHCHKVTMFEKWGEYTKPYDFCPNCGARMKGDTE